MHMNRATRRRLAQAEHGFTMIFAVMVLFIATLLVAGAFAAVEGDVKLTHTTTAQDKAYAAAQAALQVYLYNLNSNSSYWEKCEHPENIALPGTSDARYSYETLPSAYAEKKAATEKAVAKCEASKSVSIIESSNSATGTFRVKATGEAKNGTSSYEKRTIVATFYHPGFLNYVFLSVYEVEDPSTTGANQEKCEKFYPSRNTSECPGIPFVPSDELNGPFHTDDSVELCGATTFGREGSKDAIEVKGEFYKDPELFGCSSAPKINGEEITGSQVSELRPPSTNFELLEASPTKFSGRTVIELEGSQMKVVNSEYPAGTKIAFPTSGVVYVENAKVGTCPKYTPFAGNETYENDGPCGDVYIKGTYNKSLTIGAQNDVIIAGNLTEETVAGASAQPKGAATLGLIANEFVRVFHPVKCSFSCKDERNAGATTGTCNYTDQAAKEGPPGTWGLSAYPANSGWGALKNPVIDAAILSTKHSWIVDHFLCGSNLGILHVWGAIAQFWRGRVCCATTLEPGTGYLKEYNYDERLKTQQPPSFLSPTSTGGWKIERETE